MIFNPFKSIIGLIFNLAAFAAILMVFYLGFSPNGKEIVEDSGSHIRAVKKVIGVKESYTDSTKYFIKDKVKAPKKGAKKALNNVFYYIGYAAIFAIIALLIRHQKIITISLW